MSGTKARPPQADDRIEGGFDYAHAEGFTQNERAWRDWMMVGIALTMLVAIMAIVLSLVSVGKSSPASSGDSQSTAMPAHSAAAPAASVGTAAAPTLAQAKGVGYERFHPVNPMLPGVPGGPVKKFTVGVIQHVVQVSPDLAPVQAWTYTVNGVAYRGTAASPPMVVNQGDHVQVTFVNGGRGSGVDMAHSIDVHAAQIAPNLNYMDVAPGQQRTITFTAKYAGVFMYHCATQPVLMHTGAGMTGMLVVKPRHLPPAARELWLVQGEYYIGKAGGLADEAKMHASRPDVIAFNGYANQYKFAPVTVPVNRTIRLYVLNAGPSKWSAFHVIGTLLDTVDEEGVISHGAQTISLAPSQGAWMDLTLPQVGNYTFVTHSFSDMTKGAAGLLHTFGAPAPPVTGATPTGGVDRPVPPSVTAAPSGSTATAGPAPGGAVTATLGEMWLRSNYTSAKAGRVTFTVKNAGQMDHWFGIVRSPAQVSGGAIVPSSVLAQTKQLGPGATGTVTANLAAGTYELVCLMPGHYTAGQHQTFTVTG